MAARRSCRLAHFKEQEEDAVKIQDIRQIAKQLGVPSAKMNKSELIQAIQSAEGNIPCFDKGKSAECGQSTCLWREDCN